MVTSHAQHSFGAVLKLQLRLEAECSESGRLGKCKADARAELGLLGKDVLSDGSGILLGNGGELLILIGEAHYIALNDLDGEIDHLEAVPDGIKS